LQSTKSQSKTAQLLRINFEQAHRVMHRAVKTGLSRCDPNGRYYCLSIDEKTVHKGHDYLTVLSEETSGIVIDVIEGRNDDAVEELCLTALTEAQRGAVKTICSDMWQPYINGIKT
jgi:transposase